MTVTFKVKSPLPTSRQIALVVRAVGYEWPRYTIACPDGDHEQPYDSYHSVPFSQLGSLILRREPGSGDHIVVTRGSTDVIVAVPDDRPDLLEVAKNAVAYADAQRGTSYS
jgi:hypothetical protein